MIETYIAGLGLYRADEDLFDEQAARSKEELLAEVIDRCAEEVGDRTQYRKLRKYELAAMLADFATGARRNEEEVARRGRERAELVAASKAKAEAAREERRLDRAGVIEAAPVEAPARRTREPFVPAENGVELGRVIGDADPVEADVEAPADEPGPFDVGDRVEHDVYGPGAVRLVHRRSLLVSFDREAALVNVARRTLRPAATYEPELLRGADFAELVEAVSA